MAQGYFQHKQEHSENAKRSRQGKLDVEQGKELILGTINSDELYYKKLMLWKDFFNKKKRKGNYKRELAIKGLKYNFVRELIAGYNKEFGNIGRVSDATKEYVARTLLAMIEETG